MSDILEKVIAMKEKTPTERRRALKAYANEEGVDKIFEAILEEKDKRVFVRTLCDMAASPNVADIVRKKLVVDRDSVSRLLRSEDPKLRKNLVELIGRAAPAEFKDELLDALIDEETYFVLPSIILSLGNTGSDEVLRFLETYRYPKAEPKHMDECRAALEKAKSALSISTDILWPEINAKDQILLSCPSAAVTVREFQDARIKAVPAKGLSNCVFVSDIQNYKNLFSMRTFYDASIYYNKCFDTLAAADMIGSSEFVEFCRRLFGDNLKVRVDLVGFPEAEKRSAASWFASKLPRDKGVVNSPSSYAFLIRIMEAKNEYHIMVTPSSRLDSRFSYKTESVPASINPAAAAAVAYLSIPYQKKDAEIADPFCGSGTMLFERARFPYMSLTGMDISEDAIKAAKINEKNARKGAHFIIKNAKAKFRSAYDEIICNMPFGLRVSSHDENEDLYKRFVDNLSSALKPDGTAFLFTHDKKLLSAVLPENYKVVLRHTFSCGGLNPDLFIIKIDRG